MNEPNDLGKLISLLFVLGPVFIFCYLLWWLGNVAGSLRRIASALEKEPKA